MGNINLHNGYLLKNGDYRIVRTLGQGGFGITYEAEQVALGRSVSIKEFFMKEYCSRNSDTSHVSVPSEGGHDLVDRFRQKFIKEAKMIASLDHPHIVRVFDVFEENGTAYYVMDYLPGGSLSDKVAHVYLSSDEILHYLNQICSALKYIHNQSILHLDVKPSNILFNKSGNIVLIDFGISKHYDESGGQTSSTPIGISKGYAPLEQYQQNDVSRFTPATDIYSLGATLYYMSTGKTPPDASSVYEDGLERPAGLSDTIWSVIEKSMQPRRKERPQNVDAFLSILDRKNDDIKETVQNDEETVIVEQNKNTDIQYSAHDSNMVVNQDDDSTVLESKGKDKAITTGDEVYSHEFVDLGLSVKWATCNVGATKPEDYGDYYAWGETEKKKDYSFFTYKYTVDGYLRSKGYNNKRYNEVDHLRRLELIDDVAFCKWGNNWRIPTVVEFKELIDNCNWIWTTQNGISGYKVESKKSGYVGRYIFLPAAGYGGASSNGQGINGLYWSNIINSSNYDNAFGLIFLDGNVNTNCGGRYYGRSVRPVCP